ncbi:TonB-dependent receptor [Aquabacterium sp.]|uniref:TonB-dependent receptor n=1 Tax=Aquabacterium sp. TaxID=1872578 RepID=UPI002B796070|nr:TonB-dependent receptor [Aquabacterium sp.]HSW03512.1 TonB-dependent receptor [Aquabacterium sp.]
MRQLKKTAVSVAAAHVALLWSSLALAQSAPAPATAASAPAASKTEAADKPQAIIVTGQRASMISSQKLKQDADEIVDSIVAEDIGKLPDRSVTEVLQRVVGVTMDRTQARNDPIRYSVEGSGVLIRGLTYVSSQLNGRESFSANGGRMLSFEDVPPELMSGVDVYKNPSAEQIEGAIGGLVNLRTAMPFDYNGFKGSASVKASTAKLRGTTRPEYSGLLTNTWDTEFGRFGALVDVAHSESSVRTDSVFVDPYYPVTEKRTRADGSAYYEAVNGQWFPKAMGWRSLQYERTRDGAYGALQWRKGDMQSSLSLFHSQYKFYWDEYTIQASYNPYDMVLSNAKFDGDGVLTSGSLSNSSASTGIPMNASTRFFDRNSKTDELAWNFSWTPDDRWTLTSDLQLVKSKTSGFDSTVATGVNMAKQTWDLNGSIPRLVFDNADIATLNDPSKYYWGFTMEHMDRATGEQKAWKGDARFKFDHPVLSDIRFGVRLTDRDATTQNSNPSYHWAAVSQTWQAGNESWQPLGTLAYLSRFPGATHLHSLDGFMGGRSSVVPVIMPDMSVAAGFPGSYQQVHSYATQLCEEKHGAGADLCKQNWTGVPWTPATFDANDLSSLNKQSEKTQAVYSQLRFGFDDLKYPVDGNLGLRIVRTDNRATGAAVLTTNAAPQGATSTIGEVPSFSSFSTPISTSNSYTNALPSLNLRMKVGPDLQFRFAAAKAISRPDFTQLQGYTTMSSSFSTHKETVNGSEVTVVDGMTLNGTASGNPLLKPVRSNQMDLSAEWYFSKAGSLSVAAFNKDLKDIILNQTFSTRIAAADGKFFDFNITGPVNGAKGKARGVELAFQRYFDRLPGWMSGFGVQTNYTYVDSKQDRYNTVYSKYCTSGGGADNINLNINGCDTDGRSFTGLPMANLSKHTFNLALLYDQGPLSARVAYSWRSKYLYGVALNSDNTGPNQTDALDTNPASPNYGNHNLPLGLPLWADDYGQLDIGVHYKLLQDKLSIGFEAQNVTNAVYKQMMQQNIGMKGHVWQASGPRYAVSMRYTF